MRASTHLGRDAVENTAPTIFAHQSLHTYLHRADGMWMTAFARSFRIEFGDYDELIAHPEVAGASIMLPVNAEYQAESLRSIRSRHAIGLVVAVTSDVTGHSTYFAIRSGANFVINTAIPGAGQAEIICAHLHGSTRPTLRAARPPAVDSPSDLPTEDPVHDAEPTSDTTSATGIDVSRKSLPEDDLRLIRMLRGSMTVSEIARLNYMSERSMYRRIRTLYDTVGVANRTQLRRSPASDWAAQRYGTSHLTGVPRYRSS